MQIIDMIKLKATLVVSVYIFVINQEVVIKIVSTFKMGVISLNLDP